MPQRLVVGVDLGGSRIRVLAGGPIGVRAWGRKVEARAPRLADLPTFLANLWRRWRVSRHQVRALVVAARGVWTRQERGAQERRLRGLARRVRVIADAEAAFVGAIGIRPGLLVLAGTGSIVIGRDVRGKWVRAGGLGSLLGDEGSAFWIGREWLRLRARSESLTRARTLAGAPDAVARIAALAPQVLGQARRGHRGAQQIIRAAQEDLARLAAQVARSLRLPTPVAVSWAGSLLEDQAFRAGVWRSLRRQGVAARLVAPLHPPVIAALVLAALLAPRWWER